MPNLSVDVCATRISVVALVLACAALVSSCGDGASDTRPPDAATDTVVDDVAVDSDDDVPAPGDTVEDAPDPDDLGTDSDAIAVDVPTDGEDDPTDPADVPADTPDVADDTDGAVDASVDADVATDATCVDVDLDDVCDAADLCIGGRDSDDADGDGVPDACDICPGGDDLVDTDRDGVPDACDVCAEGDDRIDSDADGVPDGCDRCADADDAGADTDDDGVVDACDVCALGDDSIDDDDDGTPDACDCDAEVVCGEAERCVATPDGPECVCAVGRFGAACDGVCACEAGGACSDGRAGDGTCTCPPGRGGARCELEESPCAALSCEHGGTCEVDGDGAAVCVCPAGYVGPRCEVDIDDCLAVTCQNGGTCVDEVAGFRCGCPAGWTGRFCETPVGRCADTPDGMCCDPSDGTVRAIDDANACTVDTCNPVTGEVHHADATAAGMCCNPATGITVPVDDANACTLDTCNVETGEVIRADIGGPGMCCNPDTGAVTPVTDEDPCTIDSCTAEGTPIHLPAAGVGECCNVATGEVVAVDDANACTVDMCDPALGVVSNLDDTPEGMCCAPVDGLLTLIDDGSSCTEDRCDVITGEVEHDAFARCGDGVHDIDCDEECDDSNAESGDGCSAECRVEHCGDGVVVALLYEVCDQGALNSDTIADRCRTTCLPPRCGDGVVDSGEECDDGDVLNAAGARDGCREACARAFCGDGVLDTGEECDDENREPNDGCDSTCRIERCGDGVVQAALGEECDDANTDADDGCGPTCLEEYCGDGLVQPASGEQCDGGPNGDFTCRSDCTQRACGGPEVCDTIDNDCDGLLDEGCGGRVVMIDVIASEGGGRVPYVLPSRCDSEFDCNDHNTWTTDACVAGTCSWTYTRCDGQDVDACLDGRRLAQDGPCVNTGPILLWDFNDATPQVVDASGSSQPGTPIGGALVSGRFGRGFATGGDEGAHVLRWMRVPTTNFTLSVWVRTTSDLGGVLGVLAGDRPVGDGSVSADRTIELVDGVPTFHLHGVSSIERIASPRVDDGDWHHIALTCEKDIACVLYVDGAVTARTVYYFDTESALRDATRFVVGWTPDGGGLDGVVDDVAIFEYAASPSDISAIRAGMTTPAAGRNLESCDGTDWDCDGTAGSSCDDGNACTTGDACAGGSCVGTLGGAPDDANPCTADFCDPVDGSTGHRPLEGDPCDDGVPCTVSDVCVEGVCLGDGAECLGGELGRAGGLGRARPSTAGEPAAESYGFFASRAVLSLLTRESTEAIIFYLKGSVTAQCLFPLNDTRGSFGTWTRNPDAPDHYFHAGPIALSPARQREDGVWHCYDPKFLLVQDLDVALRPFTMGGRMTVPWPSQGFMADLSLSPPPVSIDAPYLAAGIATGRNLSYLGAPLEPGREYIFLSGLLGAQLRFPGGAIPPIPMPRSVAATFVLDHEDPMVFFSFLKDVTLRDGLNRAYNPALQVPASPIVKLKAGAVGFSYNGNLLYRSPLPLWFGRTTTAGDGLPALQFEPAINSNAHFYLMGSLAITPLNGGGGFRDFSIGILGRISVSMDPAENGYNPARASEIIWNKIFADDWSDGAGLASSDLDMRLLADGDMTVALPSFQLGTVRVPQLSLPLASAALMIDTTPSSELVAFRGRTKLNFLAFIPYLKDILAENGFDLFVDLAGYVRRDGDVSTWAISFELGLPLPIGGYPFGGRVEMGVDGDGEFFARLLGRVDVGNIRLNPELAIGTVGPVALELSDGRFCATSATAVPADSRDAAGNPRSTSCSVRLCVSDRGLEGSTFACHPFCTGNSECTRAGDVCAYGICQSPLANGAPCTESTSCASGRCHAGFCVQCWPGSRECASGRYCDNAGYCQDRLDLGEPCVSVSSGLDVMRNDWCNSGMCDTTCVECWSPNLINVARGLIDPAFSGFNCPSGEVCSDFGVCMPARGPGESCYSLGAVRGLDSWCSTGSCGDPAWTCRECNATTPDGRVLECPADQWCDDAPIVGSNTCRPRWEDGHACYSDRECLSNSCSAAPPLPGSCYTPYTKPYGAGCLQDDECSSRNCQVTFCGCNGDSANCPEAGQNCIAGDICVTPVANGVPCTDNGECISGHCAGVCVECLDDTHCGAGDICFAGACVPPAANGTPCTENRQCASGLCPAATCVECVEHDQCNSCPGGACNTTGYTIFPAPGSGSWDYFDEAHNVATSGPGNELNNAGNGTFALGQLTDGQLGGNDFIGPELQYPFVGWLNTTDATGGPLTLTFAFPESRAFTTVDVGMSVQCCGLQMPYQMEFRTSENGADFELVRTWQLGSTMPTVPSGTRGQITLEVPGAQGRYAQIRMWNEAWTFLDEVSFAPPPRDGWCDALGACQPLWEDGHACVSAIECASGTCSNIGVIPGFCYTPRSKPYGATCQVSDECASNDCLSGLCSCNGSFTWCPAGESCSATNLCSATGAGCSTDAQCRSGRCGAALVPPVPACVECLGHGDCASDRWCDAGGVCQPKWETGHACLSAVECASGYCNNAGPVPGFCYELNAKGNGETCIYGNECASTHCLAGFCVECVEDSHCGSSATCVTGACVPLPFCGDGVCNGVDTCATCPGDCGNCCGNGVCELGFGETCDSCSDCACASGSSCTAGVCVPDPFCGDGVCNGVDTCATCPGDCGNCCGNGICELGFGETCANCSDCGCGSGSTCQAGVCVAGPFCGDGVCNGVDTCATCPGDCGGCFGASCSNNSQCESRNCANHPYECGTTQCNPYTCCTDFGFYCGCVFDVCTLPCCRTEGTCWNSCPVFCDNYWCDL